MRTNRVLTVAAAALTALSLAPAALAAPHRPTPGAAGGGDPYFPRQGNGGYDVSSYRLAIGYTPSSKRLTGHARITARATQSLSRFDLDLRRTLTVSSVRVDGRRAAFSQPAAQVQELVVTPRHALRAGHRFSVEVRYAGTATPTTDPDGSLDGFIPTSDGAFVASEPQGSPTWFPVNDTPRDKARYAVSVTVPKGLTAVSNGRFVAHRTHGAATTWSWRLDRPVSSYLVTATLGKFDVTRGRTPAGVPYFVAVDPTQAAKANPVLAKLPSIVDWLARTYGRYPFGETGAIVDDAPNVGYALETATRPVFDRAPSVGTLAHELAHQWYGDTVTLRQWRDIWLNEGFAEFSTWLYTEHTGGKTTAQQLADLEALPADDDVWSPPPGNPGSGADIFAGSVYDRGAATLAALRAEVGDHVFFRIMRGWLRQHYYGNAAVGQFTAYAGRVAHTDLTAFFQTWLYHDGKPAFS
ncbi:Peptidase family M1 [Jatrophihabitans endophyticus]|uniref:Aminopeptidase N n=1 Tax=Jatrophihabitans endophyticus TaxID=1206085 RepID=A0A1M5K2Y9_9ACTN|nr:M1 family metallopeptidase [Jatrophihabitans endophyticus]SHG47114.1 Peptidase family M1 [Jatrophihabitans endophyticus]